MNEVVVFKGSINGLELVFDRSIDFGMVLEKLKAKLESAAGFFGRETTIRVADGDLTSEQRSKLINLLDSFGLKYQDIPYKNVQEDAKTPAVFPAENNYQTQTFFVDKTLRGGQYVEYKGSVVISGDVNPGAKVVADGDIVVLGACRGTVHAGASGNRSATITANKLVAGQLRIADIIARAPDDLVIPSVSERARIINDIIVIEPANE